MSSSCAAARHRDRDGDREQDRLDEDEGDDGGVHGASIAHHRLARPAARESGYPIADEAAPDPQGGAVLRPVRRGRPRTSSAPPGCSTRCCAPTTSSNAAPTRSARPQVRGDDIGREVRERIDATFVAAVRPAPTSSPWSARSTTSSTGSRRRPTPSSSTGSRRRPPPPSTSPRSSSARCEQVHEALTWLPTFRWPRSRTASRSAGSRPRPIASRARPSPPSSRATTPSRSIKWRKVYQVLETDHRRLRGASPTSSSGSLLRNA